MIMKKPAFIIHVVIGTVGVIFSGCRPPETDTPPPPKVTVAHPIQKDVVDYVEFSGKTVAMESVELRARVPGYLESVNIPKKKDGEEIWTVEPDDLLFEIERSPYQARLDATEARLKQTEAQLELARNKLDRAKRLIKDNAISKEDLQTREAELLETQARLKADRAAIERAEIDLGYTEIRSPIPGRVSRHLVDRGNLVGAGENTLLATVVKMDPMYVYFDVSERHVLSLLQRKREQEDTHKRAKVYVGLADEEDYPHEGEIDYMDNRVDPATGTVMVRGVFSNKDGFLYPGLFVRVRVPMETQKDALSVSERALGTDLGGKYLLIVGQNNVVEQRPVELGPLIDGMRVIRKGLAPDEKYIINGLQRARPGLPVQPETAGQSDVAQPPSAGSPDPH
jgi:RND family efflux transporter MFP subunit